MQTWYLISECWNRKYLMKVHLKFWRTNMTRWGGRCRDCEIKACNFPSIYQTLIGWGEIETKLKFAWNVNNLDLNTEISHAMFIHKTRTLRGKTQFYQTLARYGTNCVCSWYNCYTHVMKFIIKTTGITDRLSVLVSSPQSCRCGLTVGTASPFPSGRRLKRRVHQIRDQSWVLMKYHFLIWKIISRKWCWLMLISTHTKGWSH